MMLDLMRWLLMNIADALYVRSILTIPWIELGGTVTITCPKTGYSAQINFETKVCLFY